MILVLGSKISLYYLFIAMGTCMHISWCSTRNVVFYPVLGKEHMALENSGDIQDDLFNPAANPVMEGLSDFLDLGVSMKTGSVWFVSLGSCED